MEIKKKKYFRPEPRVIGVGSEEEKNNLKKNILERFGEEHYKELNEAQMETINALEYPKTKEEIAAIKAINKLTNSFLKKFKLPVFNVPEKNVHILPSNLFLRITGSENSTAVTILKNQAILINKESEVNLLSRISTIFHEIMHLKSHLSFLIFKADNGNKNIDIYRSGITVTSLPSKKLNSKNKVGYFTRFEGLNEALIVESEKKFISEIIKLSPLLSRNEELVWQFSKEARDLKKAVAEKNGIDSSEIVFISRDGNRYNTFPNFEQRAVFNYVLDVLFEKNKDKFKSKDKVFDLFLYSFFSGKLTDLGKIIEKSFGEKAFRVLGMMKKDKESARMVMDFLLSRAKDKK